MLPIVFMVFGCAALSAFILGGLAYFDRREKVRQARSFLLVSLLSFPVFAFLGHYYLLPEVVTRKIIRENPGRTVLPAVRLHDRKTFIDIRDLIRGEALKGKSEAALSSEIRLLMFKQFPKYVSGASNLQVIEFTKIFMEEIRMLKEKDPDLCFRLLFTPEKLNSGDLKSTEEKYYAPDLLVRENAIVMQLIASSAQIENAPPQANESLPAIRSALLQTQVKYGDDVPVILTKPEVAESNKARSIDIFLAVFDNLLGQPLTESGPALRFFFSRQKK